MDTWVEDERVRREKEDFVAGKNKSHDPATRQLQSPLIDRCVRHVDHIVVLHLD